MNYIVIDLEWNQSNTMSEQAMPCEIIEIGAVKLDEDRNMIGKFSEVIRPQLYMELHYITRSITHIKKDELMGADFFPKVVKNFFNWCGENFIFCTWGDTDLTELQRNISYYKLTGLIDKPIMYYNIQNLFRLEYEKDMNIRTLKYAVNIMGIPKDNTFHRAFYDAKYTAQILQRLDENKIKNNYSIDSFHNPKSKEEEINIVFDNYSKYISMEYESKQELFKKREILATKCCACGKNAAKKIRWFASSDTCYYCVSNCKDHGLIKGKIKLKRTLEGKIYVIKTIKFVSQEGAEDIRLRQEELRKKRKEKQKERRKEGRHQ